MIRSYKPKRIICPVLYFNPIKSFYRRNNVNPTLDGFYELVRKAKQNK